MQWLLSINWNTVKACTQKICKKSLCLIGPSLWSTAWTRFNFKWSWSIKSDRNIFKQEYYYQLQHKVHISHGNQGNDPAVKPKVCFRYLQKISCKHDIQSAFSASSVHQQYKPNTLSKSKRTFRSDHCQQILHDTECDDFSKFIYIEVQKGFASFEKCKSWDFKWFKNLN